MKAFNKIVLQYVKAVFIVIDTAESKTERKIIASDSLTLYQILIEDKNLLSDYIKWTIYVDSVDFLLRELNLHILLKSLLLSIKMNEHCYYTREILLAIYEEWYALESSMQCLYITAKACNADEQYVIKEILSQMDLRKQLLIDFTTDPSILGGFKLIIHGRIYDYSICTLLNNMKTELSELFTVDC